MANNFKGTDSAEPRGTESLRQLRALKDEELVRQLTSGYHDALTVLFERHSALVFHIALCILRNDAEAEETVHQVFLNAYRSIDQFDPQKCVFKKWLLKSAYKSAYRRAMKRREELLSQVAIYF